MSPLAALTRARIYLAKLGTEPKYWLVVSNNHRNSALGDANVVLIASTEKYQDLPSVVAIPTGEILQGYVRRDSLTVLYDDEVIRDHGAFSRSTINAVEEGLRRALGM